MTDDDYDYPPDEQEAQDTEIAKTDALLDSLLADNTLFLCVGCGEPFCGDGYFCWQCLSQEELE